VATWPAFSSDTDSLPKPRQAVRSSRLASGPYFQRAVPISDNDRTVCNLNNFRLRCQFAKITYSRFSRVPPTMFASSRWLKRMMGHPSWRKGAQQSHHLSAQEKPMAKESSPLFTVRMRAALATTAGGPSANRELRRRGF